MRYDVDRIPRRDRTKHVHDATRSTANRTSGPTDVVSGRFYIICPARCLAFYNTIEQVSGELGHRRRAKLQYRTKLT
eukprot:3335510-Prymnesium_polylepis.3